MLPLLSLSLLLLLSKQKIKTGFAGNEVGMLVEVVEQMLEANASMIGGSDLSDCCSNLKDVIGKDFSSTQKAVASLSTDHCNDTIESRDVFIQKFKSALSAPQQTHPVSGSGSQDSAATPLPMACPSNP